MDAVGVVEEVVERGGEGRVFVEVPAAAEGDEGPAGGAAWGDAVRVGAVAGIESVGAGGGRFLRQTNNSIVLLSGGLLVSREQRTESLGPTQQTDDTVIQDFLEASVKLQWDWFRYDTPELDLTTTLEFIPNITESGEYRGEFEIELKWEIVEDLFWSLSLSDKYDSKVDPLEGEKNDYSIITSIGWDF